MQALKNKLNTTSYESIYRLRQQFINAGTRGGADENLMDVPSTQYFKLFFYFSGGEESDMVANDLFNSPLLGLDVDYYSVAVGEKLKSGASVFGSSTGEQVNPLTEIGGIAESWEKEMIALRNKESRTDTVNTALNYLLINDEIERANYLVQFIRLLSNINSYSPWYFSEVSGLGTALTHSYGKIEEERRQIQIKCLPDARDFRIGTLLDLYRSACFSNVLKKEIVPANLRKFDMGIYIFSNPLGGLHRRPEDATGYGFREKYMQPQEGDFLDTRLFDPQNDWAEFGLEDTYFNSGANTGYHTSSKYIELQNCEIDINSAASAFDTINNAEGLSPEYTINISYDNAIEKRFNEFTNNVITDIIRWDVSLDRSTSLQKEVFGKLNNADNTDINGTDSVDVRLSGLINETVDNTGRDDSIGSRVKTFILGNKTTTGQVSLGNMYDTPRDGSRMSTSEAAVMQSADTGLINIHQRVRSMHAFDDSLGNGFLGMSAGNLVNAGTSFAGEQVGRLRKLMLGNIFDSGTQYRSLADSIENRLSSGNISGIVSDLIKGAKSASNGTSTNDGSLKYQPTPSRSYDQKSTGWKRV